MIVVVPMAGRGSRFADHGVQTPKPLIEVRGRPMVAWALDGLGDVLAAARRVVFVALREHDERFGLRTLLPSLTGPRTDVVSLDAVTDGQLRTVLAAEALFRPDDDVLVASCDTYVAPGIARDVAARRPDCHGIISVVRAPGDRWSFARTDETGRVVEVAEKRRISDLASTGLYYFSRADELVEVARGMFARGETTRGEYYVIPVYERYIARGWRVDVSEAPGMHDMGTPDALRAFLAAGARPDR
ncbi:glycosyl transferase family 2 [Gemmatimonadetes bacterium T265]|nr:glycosyl transferase family 2 [Gemmatimonadetes bacterium T265]